MSATITYPSTSPEWPDTQFLTLQKVLQATNTGGSGSGSVLSGNGAPTDDPGVASAIYYDLATGTLYHWNDTTESWV